MLENKRKIFELVENVIKINCWSKKYWQSDTGTRSNYLSIIYKKKTGFDVIKGNYPPSFSNYIINHFLFIIYYAYTI